MYYVMRTYSSHAAKNLLVKVCSRPMKTYEAAEDWKEYLESEEKKNGHKFFIVQTDFNI